METRSRIEIMLDAIATRTPIDDPRNREELLISAISDALGVGGSYTPVDITGNLGNLTKAVEEQNLLKYGYAIGDYFTGASGYKYYIADMNTYYGGYNDGSTVDTKHIGIVVHTGLSHTWNDTATTETGYAGSAIHEYLTTTVLNAIKSDFLALFGGTTGAEHLLGHKLNWTTATNTSAMSTNDEFISLMTQPQCRFYRTAALTATTVDGEAWKPLELFQKISLNEIVGKFYVWLRNLESSTTVRCVPPNVGASTTQTANSNHRVVALILFK